MKKQRGIRARTTAGSTLALVAALVMPPLVLNAKEISPAVEIARQLNEAFIAAAESVSAAVVVIQVAQRLSIDVMTDHPFFDQLPPETRRELEELYKKRAERAEIEPELSGRGSGIVIRENGYILTNTHVVEQAERIKVRLQSGREFEPTGVWTDPQSDIAVIKIDAEDLPVARLGDSSKIRVGEFAIAIGAPFDLDYSVTFGHISAKGRTQVVPSYGQHSLGASMDQDFIQTDASINPGNSGGPLINVNGEVIGINTLVRGLQSGIGFAVPVNLARTVSDQLISEGKYVRPWLGLAVESLRMSEMRQLVDGIRDGVVVTSIDPKGPAMISGLKPADIITAVDGSPVASVLQLRNATRAKSAGSELTLDVFRNAKSIQVTMNSAEWPDRYRAVSSPPMVARKPIKPDGTGLTVKTLDTELADQFGVEKIDGVIVTDVKQDSLAARKGLRPGDVITEIDQRAVTHMNGFREAMKAASLGKGVIVSFVRHGSPGFRILKDSGD